jgi:ribonuclease BN (tRNA processing enzyme)
LAGGDDRLMKDPLFLHFLGTGNAHANQLGSSCAVLEQGPSPMLMIDCGPDSVTAFRLQYQNRLPEALFLTHCHMDHIGGLENLFYRAYFDQAYRHKIRMYVPVRLIQTLHQRVADYPGILAEGGVNFWDCFQLIPVSETFWHADMLFRIFPVRHHQHLSAYGLCLSGVFLFTGDTRPIPEIIGTYACQGEIIFHDANTRPSPSHTGIHEINPSYRPEQTRRMVFYHYESPQAGLVMEEMGFAVARPGERFALQHPLSGYKQDENANIRNISDPIQRLSG